MEQLLQCRLCEFKSSQLQYHIKKAHGINGKQYKKMFPGEKLNILFANKEFQKEMGKRGGSNTGDQKRGKTDVEFLGAEKAGIKKEKQSKAIKGKPSKLKGRTYLQIYGSKEKAEEVGNRISKAKTGKMIVEHEERTCRCGKSFIVRTKSNRIYCCKVCQYKYFGTTLSKALKNSMNRPEVKIRIRLATIKRIEDHFGICIPNFNLTVCEMIFEDDKKLNTHSQHALYGGERCIAGFFVDRINDEYKFIEEYDEPYHYDIEGNLRPEDIERQRIIQEQYPDYEFRRIKLKSD